MVDCFRSCHKFSRWTLTLGLMVLLLCVGRTRSQEAPPARADVPQVEEDRAKAESAQPEGQRDENEEEYYELLKMFVDAIDQVDRNYVKPISRRELMEAAILGVLSKLDEHSEYIPPEELGQFRSGVDSQFGGIGIQLGRDRDELTIITPLADTPAYRAGLLPGDRIVRINGKSTEGFSMDEAITRLKGKPGTELTMTVIHRHDPKPQTVTLRREVIHIETVLGDRRKKDATWQYLYDEPAKIGYVRLSAFSHRTASDLRKALLELKDQEMRGLILDLRFNPGGLLASAVEVCDLFIAGGRIVSTEGRNVRTESWDATKDGTFEGFPMVVLVNRFSASGSEIVAACLQDHKRAVVVGQRTYGKGSVQRIVDLERGRSALKLTTAGYHRPSGRNIDRAKGADEDDEWGVTPDEGFEVRLSMRQMGRLSRRRWQRDIVGREPPSPVKETEAKEGNSEVDDESPEQESREPDVVDLQLQRGLEHVKHELAEEDEEA